MSASVLRSNCDLVSHSVVSGGIFKSQQPLSFSSHPTIGSNGENHAASSIKTETLLFGRLT